MAKLRKRKAKRMFLSADCIMVTDKKGKPLVTLGSWAKDQPKTVKD